MAAAIHYHCMDEHIVVVVAPPSVAPAVAAAANALTVGATTPLKHCRPQPVTSSAEDWALALLLLLLPVQQHKAACVGAETVALLSIYSSWLLPYAAVAAPDSSCYSCTLAFVVATFLAPSSSDACQVL